MESTLFITAIGALAAAITAMWLFLRSQIGEAKKERETMVKIFVDQGRSFQTLAETFNATVIDITKRYDEHTRLNSSILSKLEVNNALDMSQLQRIGDEIIAVSKNMEVLSDNQEKITRILLTLEARLEENLRKSA